MKKYLFHILAATLLVSILLGGCSAGSSVKTGSAQSTSAISSRSQNVSATMPESMKKALEMTDKQWADKLGNLDLNVYDYNKYNQKDCDLTFFNSDAIPTETLFMFFCYMVQSNEYPKNYYLKWYDQKEKNFYIPVVDITNTLNRYFEHVSFDPNKIDAYDSKTKTINHFIDGFGGANFPRFSKKEIISNDTLKVTISYYDPDYKEIQYSKVYTVRFTNDGYKYLSISKQ
jgi:hypothetical protein